MGLLDDAIREHLELKRRRGADAGELSRAESEALGPVRRAPDGSPDLSAIPPPAELPPEPPDVGGEPGWDEDRTAILPAVPSYEQPAAYDSPSHEPAYEPPPIPAAPPPVDPGYTMPPALGGVDPGYAMPPALPPLGEDEHPPGFEDLDEQPPPEEPPLAARDKPRLRLRLRRGGGHPDPPPPAAPPPADEYDPPTAPHERPPAAYEPPSPPPYQAPPPAEPAGEDLLEETPEFLEETPDHDRLWFEQRPPRDFDFDK